MKTLLTCTVNGEERSALADTRDTLLDLLRDRLGLTGTKEGCGNGNCGTCTVLIDGAPVNACLVLALEAPGRDIVTIEGLGAGALHPLQDALVQHGGTLASFSRTERTSPMMVALPLRTVAARPLNWAMRKRRTSFWSAVSYVDTKSSPVLFTTIAFQR